eukprot:366520-Chlamydomonas_euryale.AAC.16
MAQQVESGAVNHACTHALYFQLCHRVTTCIPASRKTWQCIPDNVLLHVRPAGLCLSIVAIPHLSVGLDQAVALPRDSYLQECKP